MNKIHRTVWSEARQCFVVASETAKSKGKASSSLAIAPVVAAALLALGTNAVLAADICTGGVTTPISTVQNTADNCVINSGEGVNIASTGAIVPSGGQAIVVLSVSTAGSISNAGTVSASSQGIRLGDATLAGGIFNTVGGTISGTYGILAFVSGAGSRIDGGITNHGLIQGTSSAGLRINGGAVAPFNLTGGIYNAAGATIKSPAAVATYGISILSYTTISGGITNSGTIMGKADGSGYAINVNINEPNIPVIDGITIAGNNTAKFVGQVLAKSIPVVVAAGAVYTMDNSPNAFQKFTVESFTNAGTLKIGATTTGQILSHNNSNMWGFFTNTGTFSPMVASTSSFGKLTVANTATVAYDMPIDVVFNDTTTCGGLTAGGTLAGVLSSTGTMTVTGNGGTLAATVTHNCTTPITINAVKSGNSINLVAVAPTTWAVTGGSGGNGTVSCTSPVLDNGTATCTGTASGGYYLASAAGCGTTSVSGNTITAGPITAACTVTGTFAAIPPSTYAITTAASPTAGGSVACSPNPVTSGGNSTCTPTAATGYTFSTFSGDCSGATCTLTNVTSAKSVTANFTANPVNGACGSALGVASAIVPNANLCAPGSTPSLVSAGSGGFSWSCTGTGVGSVPAQCTAPGATAPGGGTVTFEPLSGGCSIRSLTLQPPPSGGPGNGVVMPFGVVNFTLESCTENTARVRTTYSSSVAAMQFWKYINAGWTQVNDPTANLVISGNSVTFDIVDNGPYDADSTLHVIADPGGPGYVPAVAAAPTSIPTLSEWGLIFLSSLMAMFGLKHSRRGRASR